MNQHSLRLLKFGLLLVGSCLIANSVAAAEPKPNVIVFLTDDQGWGDLGCYGHPRIQSPNVDRFASEGMRLTQCYSACSVCSPSRSAILTGRTPYRNGVWRWIPEGSQYHLRTSEIALPSILKNNGYDTCHVGKWHLNGLFNSKEHPQPNDHGYDHWLATQNNAAPNHMNPTNFVRNGQSVGKLEGPSSHVCVEEAIRWLKDRNDKTKPFFLSVWTHEPHLPIETADEYLKLYSDIPDPDQRQHHGNVTQVDAAFGKLMSAVDTMGYRENTFVMYTADNGPEGDGLKGRTRGSTGGLRGRKRHSHEGGIRVPGIVRWPGMVKAGTTSDVPVIGTDIFATVCEITRSAMPKDRVIDSASLVPLFRNAPLARTQPLYWRNHLAPEKYRVAMRDGDWKIVGAEDLSSFELYNLKEDWRESSDLASKYPAKFDELKARLIAHDTAVLKDGPDWWKDEAPANAKPRANRNANANANTKPISTPTGKAGTPKLDIPGSIAEVYKTASDYDLYLYLFLPEGHDPNKDKRPAALFFFGGGWTGGTPTQFQQHAKYLASRGMVAAVADYRVKGRQKTSPKECVADGKSAIRYLRTHASRLGIDPSRIAAGGGSAGGHVAAATGTLPGLDDPADDRTISSRSNALLLFNPVYDNGPEGGWNHALVQSYWKDISPADNIDAKCPPALVFLGEKDALIPVSTAKRFQQRMRDVGIVSELELYPGQPHGFFNESKGGSEIFRDTIRKMDRFLVRLGYLTGAPNEAQINAASNAVVTSKTKKLLVVTITEGFRHGPAIDAAEKVLPELSAKSNGEFAFEFLNEPGPRPNAGPAPRRTANMTDEQWADKQAAYASSTAKAKAELPVWQATIKQLFSEKFSATELSKFDGVIFCNTTGELPLPDGGAFVNWISSGKAFIGMHAATDTLKAMPPYFEMINGSFAGHPWGAGGTYSFVNHEPTHPVVSMFGPEFQWKDEIYQYDHFNPASVHVLISLDMAKSKPQVPYHVPVSWVRNVGTGRLFYTSLGHNPETWESEIYQQHIVAGIRWALKMAEAPATPNPDVSSEQALRSFAIAAGASLSKDVEDLTRKAIAKAKKNPEWATKIAAQADTYRKLPNASADNADSKDAEANKLKLLQRLVDDIEK
ncbi:MAG: sulfatase-like hydrolase/transferase [Pirellula sp.]